MRKDKPSLTAEFVAFWRAAADAGVTTVPGFSDPLAKELLSPRGRWFLERTLQRRLAKPQARARAAAHVDGIILRVAFLDARLKEALAAGVRQVVILGAGYDTRAWRLPQLADARVFEVDHPATQREKRTRIGARSPLCREFTWTEVDFERDDLDAALQSVGHRADEPTVWVWEGVIMYLDDAALRGTLAVVRKRSASGSRLLAHYHEPAPRRWRALWLFRRIGEPQLGLRTREVMQRELREAGFTVLEDAGLKEQAALTGTSAPTHPRMTVSRIAVATPQRR